MNDAYVAPVEDGLQKTREWVASGGVLTKDIWELPEDCPLWKMGLSFAQACGIVSALLKEANGGPTASA